MSQNPISVHLQGNTLTIARLAGHDENTYDVSYIENISLRSPEPYADEDSPRQFIEVLTRISPRMLPRKFRLCTSWEGTQQVATELAKRVGVLSHYHRTMAVLRPGEHREVYVKLLPPTFTVDRKNRFDDIGKGFELTGPRPEFVGWDTPLQTLIERDLFDSQQRIFNGPVRIGNIYADTLEVTMPAPAHNAPPIVALQSVHRLDMPVLFYQLHLTNVRNDLSDFDQVCTALLGPQADALDIDREDNSYDLLAKFQYASLDFQLRGLNWAKKHSTFLELKIENKRIYPNTYRQPAENFTPAILTQYNQSCQLAGDIRYTPTLYKSPDYVEKLGNSPFAWVDQPRQTLGLTHRDRTHLFQLNDIAKLRIDGSRPAKGSGHLSLSVVFHSGVSVTVLHGVYGEIHKSLDRYKNELAIETVQGFLYPDC